MVLGDNMLCRHHFEGVDILPVAFVYEEELTWYVKLNIKTLEENIKIHIRNSCQNSNVHCRFCRMNVGIRLFNKLRNQSGKAVKIQVKKYQRCFILHFTLCECVINVI
jgi:hypothetical protein